MAKKEEIQSVNDVLIRHNIFEIIHVFKENVWLTKTK